MERRLFVTIDEASFSKKNTYFIVVHLAHAHSTLAHQRNRTEVVVDTKRPKFEQHQFGFDLPPQLTQDHHPHLLFELLTIDLDNSSSSGAQVYAQSRFDLPASKLTRGYKAILNVPLQTFDTKAVVGSLMVTIEFEQEGDPGEILVVDGNPTDPGYLYPKRKHANSISPILPPLQDTLVNSNSTHWPNTKRKSPMFGGRSPNPTDQFIADSGRTTQSPSMIIPITTTTTSSPVSVSRNLSRNSVNQEPFESEKPLNDPVDLQRVYYMPAQMFLYAFVLCIPTVAWMFFQTLYSQKTWQSDPFTLSSNSLDSWLWVFENSIIQIGNILCLTYLVMRRMMGRDPTKNIGWRISVPVSLILLFMHILFHILATASPDSPIFVGAGSYSLCLAATYFIVLLVTTWLSSSRVAARAGDKGFVVKFILPVTIEVISSFVAFFVFPSMFVVSDFLKLVTAVLQPLFHELFSFTLRGLCAITIPLEPITKHFVLLPIHLANLILGRLLVLNLQDPFFGMLIIIVFTLADFFILVMMFRRNMIGTTLALRYIQENLSANRSYDFSISQTPFPRDSSSTAVLTHRDSSLSAGRPASVNTITRVAPLARNVPKPTDNIIEFERQQLLANTQKFLTAETAAIYMLATFYAMFVTFAFTLIFNYSMDGANTIDLTSVLTFFLMEVGLEAIMLTASCHFLAKYQDIPLTTIWDAMKPHYASYAMFAFFTTNFCLFSMFAVFARAVKMG